MAVAGVLTQNEEGNEYVVAYASQKLNRAQKNYMTCDKKLFGVLFVNQPRGSPNFRFLNFFYINVN